MVVAQVVAHRSTDREVQSSIPLGWELGFFLSLNQWCVLNQIPHEGATLLFYNYPRKEKNGGSAVQLEAQLA